MKTHGKGSQVYNSLIYHAPTADDLPAYQEIRDAGLALAQSIVKNTPASADQTAAIRKVREAVMTANSARACKGL